ncbi:MAG: hypothetical protein AB8G23_01325 [Myxococcota bacterium]
MTKIILLVQFASTWYLVGLCWLVQRVQYPLMNQVGVDHYRAYEQAHVTQIGPVVAPMMLIEVATAILLFASGDAAFRRPAFLLSLVLLAVIWGSTFLLQVPMHNTLGQGFDAAAHTSLVQTNWIRTLAWTARGLILIAIMHSSLRGPAA